MTVSLTEAEQFFYDNAGYSHAPDESPEDGRIRCARALAAAESRMNSGPYDVSVSPDTEYTDGEDTDSGPFWLVELWDTEDEDTMIGSIGGVDCASDSGPYIRVVGAELALDYFSEADAAIRPTIRKGPADNYADSGEIILEFNSGMPNGPGGLLSLKRAEDGTLTVSLYRLDSGVTVNVMDAAL